MKKLLSPGNTLILASPSYAATRSFDAWPSHGVLTISPLAFQGDSLAWYVLIGWRLKSLEDFYYVIAGGLTDQQAVDLIFSYQTFICPDGFLDGVGEHYNYVLRGKTFDKFLQADLVDWLAGH